MFLLTSLFAFLTAVVVARMQHRSWHHQQWEKLRSDRTQAALATVERALALIDKRVDRQPRFLSAIQPGHHEGLEDAQPAYRAAVVDWNDNLGFAPKFDVRYLGAVDVHPDTTIHFLAPS